MSELESLSLHFPCSGWGPHQRFIPVLFWGLLCALKIIDDPEEFLFICCIYWYLSISEVKTEFLKYGLLDSFKNNSNHLFLVEWGDILRHCIYWFKVLHPIVLTLKLIVKAFICFSKRKKSNNPKFLLYFNMTFCSLSPSLSSLPFSLPLSFFLFLPPSLHTSQSQCLARAWGVLSAQAISGT